MHLQLSSVKVILPWFNMSLHTKFYCNWHTSRIYLTFSLALISAHTFLTSVNDYEWWLCVCFLQKYQVLLWVLFHRWVNIKEGGAAVLIKIVVMANVSVPGLHFSSQLTQPLSSSNITENTNSTIYLQFSLQGSHIILYVCSICIVTCKKYNYTLKKMSSNSYYFQMGKVGQHQNYGRNYFKNSNNHHKGMINFTNFVVISTKMLTLSQFSHSIKKNYY